jgi:hypothetical protein
MNAIHDNAKGGAMPRERKTSAHDPYGHAMTIIATTLRRYTAPTYAARMSDDEYLTLCRIRDVIAREDPASLDAMLSSSTTINP